MNTLMSRTIEQIKEMIHQESLKPGDKLPTLNQLAEKFGVSRTVIREAVISLSSDGVLESRAGVGGSIRTAEQHAPDTGLIDAILSPLSLAKSSFIDILELRMAFEVHAAGLAASRRSWAQETAIWDAAHQLEAAIGDEAALDECDAAFHRAIAEATNNSAFMEFFNVVSSRITPRPAFTRASDPALVTPEYIQQTVIEHRAICEAIRAGDAERAQREMRTHLERGHRRYRTTPDSIREREPSVA